MAAAPATYDFRYIQDLANRLENIERQLNTPKTKITLLASDDTDRKHLKDITVDSSDVITAADAS